jgi:transposase InsO family protein
MIAESDKQMAIALMDEAMRAGARASKACHVLGLSTRTLRRWRQRASLADARKGAAKHCPQALSNQDRQHIIAVCNTPEHQSLPPSQIVPRLADAGVYIASESSFYRVLRAHGQVQRRGRARTPRSSSKPQAIKATAPNQVWSWDITYLPSTVRGQFLRLYLVLDVYSRAIVGWEVHENECASHAAQLIIKACLRHQVARNQLVLHSDNGSPMKGATMLATLQRLGVMPSFSRPSVSDDNAYSESLFRTLKYGPSYPRKPFADIAAARQWVQCFVRWYNEEHRHSGIRFVTPAQRHANLDRGLLAQRASVYEAAKKAMPERWRGRAVRNWALIAEVWLNPDRPQQQNNEFWQQAA